MFGALTRLQIADLPWRKLVGMLLTLVAIGAGLFAYYGYAVTTRTEPVVVAAADVPPGTLLTPELLEVAMLPVTRPATLRGLAARPVSASTRAPSSRPGRSSTPACCRRRRSTPKSSPTATCRLKH